MFNLKTLQMEKKVYKVEVSDGPCNGADWYYDRLSIARAVSRRYVRKHFSYLSCHPCCQIFEVSGNPFRLTLVDSIAFATL